MQKISPRTSLRTFAALVVAGVMFCAGGLAQANSMGLGLVLQPTPDIFVQDILLSRTGSNFSATGDVAGFNGVSAFGFFSLTGMFDAMGYISGANLVIDDGEGMTFLTANTQTAFGFNGVSGNLEFLMSGLGGNYAPQYTNGVGIIISQTGLMSLADLVDGQPIRGAIADVGTPVPEPSTLLLMLTGGAILYGWQRRRQA